MSKKLKIQFWRAKLALAMQILEQEGLPSCKEDGEAHIWEQPAISKYSIDLRGLAKWANLRISHIEFDTNAERDAYLQKVVNAITDELFSGSGKLEVGKLCEVCDDDNFLDCRVARLLAILPENYATRYICDDFVKYVEDNEGLPRPWLATDYVRPITKCTEPKIEECGQLVTYTWEEK